MSTSAARTARRPANAQGHFIRLQCSPDRASAEQFQRLCARGRYYAYQSSGRIVQRAPITIGAIFPSRFHTINETVRGLPPGKYLVELAIDYGGDEIEDGETTVTVP